MWHALTQNDKADRDKYIVLNNSRWEDMQRRCLYMLVWHELTTVIEMTKNDNTCAVCYAYAVTLFGFKICLGKNKWWLCFGYWFAYAERHWNVKLQATVSETRDIHYKSLQILWQLVRTESERKQASQIKKYFFF